MTAPEKIEQELGVPKPVRRTRRFVLVTVAIVFVLAVVGFRPLMAWYGVYQGQRALKRHDEQAALRFLLGSAWWDAKNPRTQFLLARTFRRLDQRDRFRQHLDKARELGWTPRLIEREEWLAAAQAGRLADVQSHLAELLTDPGDDGAEICEAFTNGFFQTHQFGHALAVLNAWLADFPDDPYVYAYRGMLWQHQQKWDDAIKEFQRAIELAPHRLDVRLRMVTVMAQKHEYESAKEHIQKCLEQAPNDTEVLYVYAQWLRATGRPEESRTVLTRVLQQVPGHFGAQLTMGQLELGDRRPQEALRWLRPLCELGPIDVEARYALAQALQAAGEADAAQEHFTFVTQSREKLANVQAMIDTVTKEPDNVELRYQIGVTLLEFYNPAQGEWWLRSALDWEPDHEATHRALAAHYEKLKNADLAERHRRLADAAQASGGGRTP